MKFNPKNHEHPLISIEYSWDTPEHYDGISEYYCKKCNKRWGRWSGKELKENEREPVWGGEK